jgi:PAS domain S-box-containing protein
MDTTESKRAEKKLRRSEESLLEAQKLSHTGSWRHDVASGAVIVSPEFYRIHDIKPDDDASNTDLFFSRFHPEDRKRVVDFFEKAEIEKTEFQVDYRIVLPDGTIKHLHTIGHPILNESGDLVEFVGTAMDVTAAKQAEEALRRSESYLADAQTLIRTGSWAWNVATRQSVYWSQENYRLFGFNPEGGIPSDEAFYERIHPEDRDRVRREVFLERPDEGSHFDVEFRIALPGGAIKYVRSTGHTVRNMSADVLEYVGTSIDVTERKRADEERERLRQVQADLAHLSRVTTMGELTASLAHEIRQPISAAVTNAKTCLRWLGRDEPDVAEAREAASRLVKDVTRAADIIGRISSLFKKGALQRELVDVNELIGEMIVLLRSEATRYSISFGTELAEDLPKVMADRVQLQQVLMNLMLNGIDAMKAAIGGGRVTIKSVVCDAQLLISVSDTGVGLPQEREEEIFHAFFTTKEKGTGMGLPISRSIIESHGGRLWAAGAPGSGTTFQFTLPTASAHP